MSEAAGGHIFDLAVVDQFADKKWRMANLYYILDEGNREVKFVPNDMQAAFDAEMWYFNLILKCRQIGFTTYIDLYILDDCVFIPNQLAGIIAHTIDDVKKIFRRKIKHPYERLPPEIRAANPAGNDSAQELVFANGSEISVGTTMRSGTLSHLHVSEFGYICAKFPEKADEIVTGSFNTVHPGSMIWVEATGYGKQGKFYEMCQAGKRSRGRPLSKLDFKYHFYPWWQNSKYSLPDEDAQHVVFTRQHHEYFRRIERSEGIVLTLNQRAWWVKKKEVNGDQMGREFPSHDREPFEVALRGAIFAKEIAEARDKGRITKVKFDKALTVDTWWDLGRGSGAKMAIWFIQTIGNEYRAIWYHEDTLHSLQHYLTDVLTPLARDNGWTYRHHLGPHDLEVTDLTESRGRTRWEIARSLGFTFQVGQQWQQGNQIDAAKLLIPMMWFDEENCAEGLNHLELFRYEWNENLQVYHEQYRHDEHSHASSAFMTGAMMQGLLTTQRPRSQAVSQRRFAT